MPNKHQVTPGDSVSLADYTTDGKDFHEDRKEAEKEFTKLREEFIEWQRRLYAAGDQKLLIVLQARDTGGKDGTIRKILDGVNPQGVRVTSFKAPSHLELAHDYLWRIHQAVPPKGMIGIFNRSQYEDVLIVRVLNFVPESVWRPRYQQLNDFEKLLTASGTKVLKFYLHISKEEQRERLQDRLDDPNKHWKFTKNDLSNRKLWDDYTPAYEEMLTRCSTDHAPWHIIPADQKWYRNLAIMRTLVAALREMNPEYPAPEEGLEKVVIE